MQEVKQKSLAGVALAAKVFGILDQFQRDRPGWSQAELVQATGMNRSTVNRLVRFLAELRYLCLNKATGRYQLGSAAVDPGSRAAASFDLRSLCRPTLERLASLTRETCILTTFDPIGLTGVCSDQIEGRSQGLRAFENIGSTCPLHAGAAPKAILAYLPHDLQAQYLSNDLAKLTANTLVSKTKLAADLKATRARGYSLSDQEIFEGTAGVAAPIPGIDSEVIASIAVALPTVRASDTRLSELGAVLPAAANEISKNIWGNDQ